MAGVCDFCGEKGYDEPGFYPVGHYPCDDFTMYCIVEGQPDNTDLDREYLGEWSACKVCNYLIEADLWDVLLKQSIARLNARLEKNGEPRIEGEGLQRLEEHLLSLWASFRHFQTGHFVQANA
jgi:hypothetical protein